jgi:hypothetical protein
MAEDDSTWLPTSVFSRAGFLKWLDEQETIRHIKFQWELERNLRRAREARAVTAAEIERQLRILNYCRSLTKTDIFTFDALSANCCRCTLP